MFVVIYVIIIIIIYISNVEALNSLFINLYYYIKQYCS